MFLTNLNTEIVACILLLLLLFRKSRHKQSLESTSQYGFLSIWGKKILVLPRATFLVSNGNNIVARNFARFAAIDVKPEKSPLETEQVARNNIKIWTSNLFKEFSSRLTQLIIVVQYFGKIKLCRYLHYYCCFLFRGNWIEQKRYKFVGKTFFFNLVPRASSRGGKRRDPGNEAEFSYLVIYTSYHSDTNTINNY